MRLLSAEGRLPQAEKSRDPVARSPPLQVYDFAEGDRDNAAYRMARHKNSSGREFSRESAVKYSTYIRIYYLKSAGFTLKEIWLTHHAT